MATVAIQTGSKPKVKPLLLLLIVAVIGTVAFLIWKYRFWIKGKLSGGNATDGPDETGMQNIITSANDQPGGLNNTTGGSSQPVTSYWPLKKGSKNENVRWVQIMVNKVPNTGSPVIEDGNWGPKTEAKVKAAGAYFGLTKTEISAKEYMKMFCKTWPVSKGCTKILEAMPNLFNE